MFYAYICETSILVVETRYFTKSNISHCINREWPLWWVCEGSHWRKLVGFLHTRPLWELQKVKHVCRNMLSQGINIFCLASAHLHSSVIHPNEESWSHIPMARPLARDCSQFTFTKMQHDWDIKILRIEKQESLPSKMALPHITTSHLSHSKYVSPVDRI